jgi:hypothetical protein
MGSFCRRHGAGMLAVLVVCGIIFGAAAAHAQTVDLRSPAMEVVTWIAGLLASALTAVAAVGIRLILVKVGMENSKLEQNLNDRLNDIIYKGMDFALATAENEVKKKGSGLEAVKFDNIFISYAASYVAERAPQILKKFTVTQEKLEEMIWARVPAYMQTVPITGGAKTPETVKQVNIATGGVEGAKQTGPVIVEPVRETPLPADRSSGIFSTDKAPDTGA